MGKIRSALNLSVIFTGIAAPRGIGLPFNKLF